MTLKYSLSNFNESLILIEELFAKMIWMKYYHINYLGQNIQCSIEFPDAAQITLNKIDFESANNRNKTIELQIKIRTNYPIVNQRTEISASNTIEGGVINTNPHKKLEIVINADNTQRKFGVHENNHIY